MIPLDQKPKNLEEAIRATHQTKEELHHSWRMGEFGRMIRKHLMNDKKLIVQSSDPEEYPRLRCYRGTGHKFELVRAIIYDREIPPVVVFTVRADWVNAGIDPMQESEGCPGADVRTLEHEFRAPLELVKNPTQKEFDVWVKNEIARQASNGCTEATAKIKALAKAAGLKVSISLE